MTYLERWIAWKVHGVKLRRHRKVRRCGVLRDRRLRKFIASHPCAACGTTVGVECAHTGAHGLGIKSSDDTGIPLCWWDHWASNTCLHKLGPREFERVHRLHIGRIVRELNAEWKLLVSRKEGL